MIEKPNHIETLAPAIRLQVWHLDKRGQSKAVNRQLSDYLAQTTLFTDWAITPASAQGTRDHYVPIQVDLTFRTTRNPDQESTDVSLRWLFNSTLATEVESFFSQRDTKPIHMNVYPTDQDLTDDIKMKFTHYHLFFSLELDSGLVIEDSMHVDRNDITESLRIGGCVLDAYAALDDNGVNMSEIGKEVLEGKSTVGQLWNSLRETMSDTPLGDEVAKHYSNDESSGGKDISEIKSCWQESLKSLQLFQTLASQVQTCASNMAGREKPSSPISKEEVHLALVQANLATFAFAEHQKSMIKVLKKMNQDYKEDIKGSRNVIGLAIVVMLVAAGAVCTGGLSLVPTAAAVAVAGGGGLVVVDQRPKLADAYNKESAVSQFDQTIDNLADAIKDAKLGLAAIYCSDILQVPLQSMGPRERVEILKNLGIDMKELNNKSVYNEELVKMRMERFVEAHEIFESERRAILRDAKLKEVPGSVS